LLLLFYRYHYSPILVAFAERIFSGETHTFGSKSTHFIT